MDMAANMQLAINSCSHFEKHTYLQFGFRKTMNKTLNKSSIEGRISS
jgi:hypothetical protein